MAVNTFTGAINSNYGTSGNWSLGTTPNLTDGHTTTFDAASPACTVDTSNRGCTILEMSAYLNTITMTFGISVGGSITLGAGMTMSGTGYIQSYTGSTSLTSNGCYVPRLILSGVGAHTKTLNDDWNVGIFSAGLTTNVILTINGFTIFVNDDWDLGSGVRTMTGTTVIELSGSGPTTWGGSFAATVMSVYSNPIVINKSGGTLTLDPYIYFQTSGTSLTYTAGVVDGSNCLLTINNASTLSTGSNVVFNEINIFTANSTINITLNDTLYANTFTCGRNLNFLGTSGINFGEMILYQGITTLVAKMTLISSLTYTVGYLRVYGSPPQPYEIISSTPSTKAILNLTGTSEVINCNPTDIDSSGGNKIWTLGGTITNSDNWGVSNSSIPPVTVSYFG